MLHTKALYAGTFDPLTNGHEYVIDTACHLFETVVIGIGTNPAKSSMFTPEERRSIINAAYPNIECIIYTNRLMVNVANELECTHIVRGIRNSQDLQYETDIAMLNVEISDSRQFPSTIFIPTPMGLSHVSSSMVKGLIGFDSWEENISMFVPDASHDAILKKIKGI